MKQHYKDMPIEPFVLMERLLTAEEFIGFIKGNAIKYSLVLCEHTHWITYVSWKKKECVDCHIQKPLYDLTIEHQR